MEISNTSKMLAGVILVTVPTIEYGGSFLLGMLRRAEPGYVDNALRHDLFQAGHAHAGVMVFLSLIFQLLADVVILPGWLIWIARLGAPCAAILMPLGRNHPRQTGTVRSSFPELFQINLHLCQACSASDALTRSS